MEIYLFGTKATCPKCSGIVSQMKLNKLYKCHDCGAVFKVTGQGYGDSFLEVEELKKGEKQNGNS